MALDTMRKGASRFFGVLLIILLVISFAVWGIADIFTGYGSQTLVKVGDIEIGQNDYTRVQREVLQSMSERAGKQVTLQDARKQGLDAAVLERIIGGAAVDNHARELNLGIGNDMLLQEIMKDPGFADSAGKFSPVLLQQTLQAYNMDEATFLNVQRERNLRRQLLSTLGETVAAPELLINALDVYNNQTRTLRFILVPADAVPPSPTPTETELKTFYDNHQAEFTQPETRLIGLLNVSPDTVKGQVKITDAEIQKIYETDKAKFDKPEKRHVYQMSFPDKAKAQAAYDKIAGGAEFQAVAKEQGLEEADFDLGVLSQSQLADPVLAETAFKLEEKKVSAPVQGKLGAIALLYVTNIVPGEESTLESAKATIEKDLLADRAQGAILDLHDKIEDERASGATLEEVGKKLNVPYVEFDVDRQGRTRAGVEQELPQEKPLLEAAFASDTGVENDPVDAREDGFVWYEVLNVTQQQVKPFDQVKGDVEQMWRQDDRQARLTKFADGLIAELKKGKSFEDVAKQVGATIETTTPLKRTGMALNVLPQAVAQAFTLPEKGFGQAEAGVQDTRIIFQVEQISPPAPLEAPAKVQLARQLKLFVSDDILSEYFGALQDRYKVTVNQAAIARITGTEEQP